MNTKRIDLYVDYCLELEQYDPNAGNYPIGQAQQVAITYLSDDRFLWTPIMDGVEEVGFLITAVDLEFFGRGTYICEAYVAPSHRGHGLMTNAVREMLKDCDIVHFEVFLSNPAMWFWRCRMIEAGFRETTAKISPLTQGAIHFAYEKRGN